MTNFEEFEAAQDEYKRIVKKTCEALLCDINKTEHIVSHDKYDLMHYKTQKNLWEYSFAGNVYRFHGLGCTACMSDGTVVDWDFGGSHDWCMIEPYKMANTLEKNHYPNMQYHDGAFVRSLCEEFAAQGLLSGNDRILEYHINYRKKGTKPIVFPDSYASLIIQYSGKQKVFERSKRIDQFIRKSTTVYKEIEQMENNYQLIFVQNGKQLPPIPYNNMAYPEAAAKLMDFEILKPYRVENGPLDCILVAMKKI